MVAAPRVQTLDYTTLALVCRELSTVLTPARLEHIVQSDDFTLLIQLRTLEGFRWLLLSWQPESARVALIEDPPLASKGNKAASKSSFYSLPSTLKSYLQYKMLIGVTLPLPGERIAIFEFADRATDTVATYQVRAPQQRLGLADMPGASELTRMALHVRPVNSCMWR